MFLFRRKGIRRRGNPANTKARLTGGRLLIRLGFRLLRPFGPGMLAAYFLDSTAGGERRKAALARLNGVKGIRTKTPE